MTWSSGGSYTPIVYYNRYPFGFHGIPTQADYPHSNEYPYSGAALTKLKIKNRRKCRKLKENFGSYDQQLPNIDLYSHNDRFMEDILMEGDKNNRYLIDYKHQLDNIGMSQIDSVNYNVTNCVEKFNSNLMIGPFFVLFIILFIYFYFTR